MNALTILKRAEYPDWLNVPEVRGICVDGCIMGHTWRKTELAHTHQGSWLFKYRRWICFRFKHTLNNKAAGLHELAHVLTKSWNYAHGKVWRKRLLSLGGSLDSSRLGGLTYMPNYHHKECPRKRSIREQCKCV